MKQVDRLLIEAKKLAGYSGPELTLALVERFGDSWTAAAHLWDRLPGHSPAIKKSATHDTGCRRGVYPQNGKAVPQ